MSAEALVRALRSRHLTLALAESCTGGLLAGAVTEVPGASAVLDRGWVSYSNAAKREALGVAEDTLIAHGAVSEPVAAEMAAGALSGSRADLAASVTGIAGPGGSEAKPEGRVCFAILRRGRAPRTQTVEFGAIGRSAVRRASVAKALRLLLDHLVGDD